MARGTSHSSKRGPHRPAGGGGSSPVDAPTIRIVVADEHTIDRKGLSALLAGQPDFAVVGEAATAGETVERCRMLRPAVLLLDTRVTDRDGTPAISEVRAAAPETHVLAVAGRAEGRCLILNPPRPDETARLGPPCDMGTDCLRLAVMRGATGAIRRTASAEELCSAVRAVASGNTWLEPGVAARLAGPGAGAGPAHEIDTLSPRDLEVAALIADGRCNKEIGRTLGITEATVKKHVGRILARLGLQDRLQVGLHVARHPELLERHSTDAG